MTVAIDRLGVMQSAVLAWYAANGRDLAFRRTSDPWAILVSEVMAQQTQAVAGGGGLDRFMTQFPTPASLAAASPATVIRAWRGLGYNRRALALRGAAMAIVEEHDGRVPDTLEALQQLPGIGPYTARAVLAIAFGRPVAALDVNIGRVIGRAFIGPTLPPSELQPAADGFVPRDQAADWTHALMDIGAAFCRPRNPRCDACPLRASCAYRSAPVTEARRPFGESASGDEELRALRIDEPMAARSQSWTASATRRMAHGWRSPTPSASTGPPPLLQRSGNLRRKACWRSMPAGHPPASDPILTLWVEEGVSQRRIRRRGGASGADRTPAGRGVARSGGGVTRSRGRAVRGGGVRAADRGVPRTGRAPARADRPRGQRAHP